MDPADLLRAVLARPGADTSAAAIEVAEVGAASAPARLAAEGAAALDARGAQRYVEILRAAGFSDTDIAKAKEADIWRPLLSRMHHAERIGVDLDRLANLTALAPDRAPDDGPTLFKCTRTTSFVK